MLGLKFLSHTLIIVIRLSGKFQTKQIKTHVRINTTQKWATPNLALLLLAYFDFLNPSVLGLKFLSHTLVILKTISGKFQSKPMKRRNKTFTNRGHPPTCEQPLTCPSTFPLFSTFSVLLCLSWNFYHITTWCRKAYPPSFRSYLWKLEAGLLRLPHCIKNT